MGSLNSTLSLDLEFSETPLAGIIQQQQHENNTGADDFDDMRSYTNGNEVGSGNFTGESASGSFTSTCPSSPESSPRGAAGSAGCILTRSRHPAHSAAYDFAHGGQWQQLMNRCRSHPAECSYVDRFNNTPLHLACRRQPPLKIVQALLAANPGSIFVETVDGLTPLHFACYCGASVGIVSILLESNQGATKVVDRMGRTPLHFVSSAQRTKDRRAIIAMLLGVDSGVVTWEDSRGRTPLMLLFEDYAEEIEEVHTMTRVLRKKILAPKGSPVFDDDDDDTSTFYSTEDALMDYDPADIREGWECIILLLEASYYHLHRSQFRTGSKRVAPCGAHADEDLQTILSEGGLPWNGNRVASHLCRERARTGLGTGLDAFLQADRSNVHHAELEDIYDDFDEGGDEEGEDGGEIGNGRGKVSQYNHRKQHSESQRRWNIVHAAVGVPFTPPKFVSIVLSLFPNLAAQKDVNGDLPLHVAVRAPLSLHESDDEPTGLQPRAAAGREMTRNSVAAWSSMRDCHLTPLVGTPHGDDARNGNVSAESTYCRGESPPCNDRGSAVKKPPLKSWRDEPSVIIRELLKVHPPAAASRDAAGNLPLHVAIERGRSWDAGGVKYLVEATFDLAVGGENRAGNKMNQEEEEEVRNSFIRALCSYSKLSSKEVTNVDVSTIGEDGKEDIQLSAIQFETCKTLSKLLPRFCDKNALAEELLSRSLVSNRCRSASMSSTTSTVSYKSVRAVQPKDVATKAAMLDALGTVLGSCVEDRRNDITHPAVCVKDMSSCALDVGKKMAFSRYRCVRECAAKVLGRACERLGITVTSDVLREVVLGVGEDLSPRFDSDDDEDCITSSDRLGLSVALDHGRACCIYHIFCADIGSQLEEPLFADIVALLKKRLMRHQSSVAVREMACLACGAVLSGVLVANSTQMDGTLSPVSSSWLRELKSPILRSMRPTESSSVHLSLARGLSIATRANARVFTGCSAGVSVLDGALMLAMGSSCPTVKIAYNDVLWLALRVGDGEDGLHEYMRRSQGENGKIMMALVTKVLGHMNHVTLLTERD